MKYSLMLIPLMFVVSCGTKSPKKHKVSTSETYAHSFCAPAIEQSFINIIPTGPGKTRQWELEYKKTALNIYSGHTIQVTPQEGSSITLDGKKYHLKQFHFHTPGEHILNSTHAPIEIHFVHRSDDEKAAVIAMMVEPGESNLNYKQLIENLPNDVEENRINNNVNLDLNALIHRDLSAFHYVGSLPTPPGNESVQWMVLKNPISMSRKQIAEFTTRLEKSERRVLTRNSRRSL